MNEDKGTRYRRAERGLRLLEVSAAATALLVLACSRVPGVVAGWGRGWAPAASSPTRVGLAETCAAAAVLVVCLGVATLVAAPFAGRRQGALARRYNLPALSGTAFLRQQLRQAALLVLAGLATWVVFARVSHATPWLAGVVTALVLLTVVALVMGLAPWLVLLSPRVRPLRDEAVAARLHALASRAGLRLAGLHEWADEAEGDHANAALVGVVGPRRLLLSDTLIAGCPLEEMEAVVAHELGHHEAGHTWLRVRAQAVGLALAVLVAQACAAGPARWVGGTQGGVDPASIAWMLVGAALTWVAIRPWLLAQSRLHEAEADAFALALTGRPDVLARVLARLGARNLASEESSLLTRAFFLTHPPIPARIAAARRAAEGAALDP